MAAKKTSKTKAPSKKPAKTSLNKSAFIRANPSLGTAELIEKAKKAGLELSTAYVYTLRSSDRAKGVKAPTKTSPSPATNARTTPAAPRTATTSPKGVEAQFVSAILEMGAGRAEELFKATVAKVRALAK